MPKTYQVELGGKARPLRFHQRDAIELKKRFGEPPQRLLFIRCLGLDFKDVQPGDTAVMDPGLLDPEVQFAVLHKALVRGGWNVTEEKVIDMVDEALKASDGAVTVATFVAEAVYCAFYSGAITGKQVDLQEVKTEDASAPAPEGEAPASEPK